MHDEVTVVVWQYLYPNLIVFLLLAVLNSYFVFCKDMIFYPIWEKYTPKN